MRVYELAKEAGVTSADVLRAAESCGVEVTSAISSVDGDEIASLKEAVAKSLGTGFAQGVMPWTIEVIHAAQGAPQLLLHGEAQARFAAMGGARAHLSLSHEGDMAMAMVILEGE